MNTLKENDLDFEMFNRGINPQGYQVLETIGIDLFSVQRFRDAGYDKYRKRIWLLTRTGTESNLHLIDVHNRNLEENDYFLKRYDEPMDATYEILLFNCPKNTSLKHVSLPNLALLFQKVLERQEKKKIIELAKWEKRK